MMKVMTDLNGGFRMMQKVLGYVIEDSIVKEEEAKILTHINVAFWPSDDERGTGF